MIINESSHPIDIILKLVINGEVDPWKVDIVDLADKYLMEIKNLDIPNLRIASKILYGAVLLLKMKAEALELEENKESEKKSRKRLIGIKRYYTIDELANVLKKYISPEVKIKKVKSTNKKRKYTRRKVNNIPNIPLFHATLEEAIEFIKKEIEKLNKRISLKEINYPNKAQAFVSLLFLNYDKIVNLIQEEHFGDIYIEKNIELEKIA
jgi:segregation and condensation protein A